MAEVIANFSAGPAALPPSVRQIIAEGLSSAQGPQPSLVEISHRGPVFLALAEELVERLKSLLDVADSHEILLLQGGANQQFAQFPLNFAHQKTPAFILSGHWGEKALAEAKRIGDAVVAASSKASGYLNVPDLESVDTQWAYLHYTGNETIHGVQFQAPPNVDDADLPIVADLSSEFLSRPYGFKELSGFYAGAQKNLGVSGLTVVGLSKKWLTDMRVGQHPHLPAYFNYQVWLDSDSMFNTPTTFAWWVALEVLRWIEREGGLEVVAARNQRKAHALYECIDQSGFYVNSVATSDRSVMNVPFWIHDQALEPVFVREAEAVGLLGLKGHRVVGGLRASLYNAIDADAVIALVGFMKEFERSHG